MYVELVNGTHLRWRLYVDMPEDDTLMGTTNAYMARANRSNTDFKVLIDRISAIEYVTKYVSKSEKPSKPFNALLHELAKNLKEDAAGAVEGVVGAT